MGKALHAYRRYRELADRGEFGRLGEVLDENWIENCLGLTGWTLGLDIALTNLQAGFGRAFSGLQVTQHEVVEDGDAAPQLGHDHLPIDRLGSHDVLVPHEVGDVLQRHSVGAEQGHERVPQFPRHPVGTEARCLSDLPELPQHVVTIEWPADRCREDQAVILPQRSGFEPVSSLTLVVLAERLHGQLRKPKNAPALPCFGVAG
jgi:hypothetical protein